MKNFEPIDESKRNLPSLRAATPQIAALIAIIAATGFAVIHLSTVPSESAVAVSGAPVSSSANGVIGYSR